jgi:CheY-like chemotaxis protein
VVDGGRAVCELVHSVLESAGMQTLELGSAAEAQDFFREEKFAVLLFDLRTGWPLARALQEFLLPLILKDKTELGAAVTPQLSEVTRAGPPPEKPATETI